jgi:hypothetical protein
VTCALCGCELKGFSDGVMVEMRLGTYWRGFPGQTKNAKQKVLVCRDDDACGKRRLEAEQKRNVGETP